MIVRRMREKIEGDSVIQDAHTVTRPSNVFTNSMSVAKCSSTS